MSKSGFLDPRGFPVNAEFLIHKFEFFWLLFTHQKKGSSKRCMSGMPVEEVCIWSNHFVLGFQTCLQLGTGYPTLPTHRAYEKLYQH